MSQKDDYDFEPFTVENIAKALSKRKNQIRIGGIILSVVAGVSTFFGVDPHVGFSLGALTLICTGVASGLDS